MNAADVIKNARAGLDDCLLSPWGERSIAALLALAEEQAATIARVRAEVAGSRINGDPIDPDYIHFALNEQDTR